MRILIIEDEPLVAESIMKDVIKLLPEARLEGPLMSVREVRDWLQNHPLPDLILADIQLSDGVSFDALSFIRTPCPIIFITAYDEYALRAFHHFSLDYLLKPFHLEDLKRALDKYQQLSNRFENRDFWLQLQDLLKTGKVSVPFKERFAVTQGAKVLLIDLEHIGAFLKDELIFLISKDGHKWLTDYKSLDELEDLLDPNHFYRANRQLIVHKSIVQGYRTDSTRKLEVIVRIPVLKPVFISKEKATDFKEWLVR